MEERINAMYIELPVALKLSPGYLFNWFVKIRMTEFGPVEPQKEYSSCFLALCLKSQ